MKRYITTEKIRAPLGNDRYETLYEKGEVVVLVHDDGPFAFVQRPGRRERPRTVSWSKLKEYKS